MGEPRIDALSDNELVAIAQVELAKPKGTKRDDRALNELLRRYEPLTKRQTARIVGRNGAEMDDLITTAQIAFIESVRLFDPSRGNGIGVYAKLRVHGALVNYVRTLIPAKLSYSAQELAQRIIAVRRTLQEQGYEGSDEQVAEEIGIPLYQMQALTGAMREPLSFDPDIVAIDHRDDGTVLPARFLSCLDARERAVMMMISGMSAQADGRKDASAMLGLSVSRVRQIELTATSKANHPTHIACVMYERCAPGYDEAAD